MNTETIEMQVNDKILDGDHPGHPFRGNGAVTASGESRAAGGASRRAKHAEKHGDAKAQAKAHKTAHFAHKAAAVEANGVTKKYHETMARFHGKRAGAKVLDSVTAEGLLDAVPMGDIEGVITMGGKVIGRAAIAGGDGKSMVYVGAEGDERVKPVDGDYKFYFTEDDESQQAMVQSLIAGAAAPVVGEQSTGTGQLPAGTLVGQIAAIALELRNLGWKTTPVREGYSAESPRGSEVVMEPEAGGEWIEFDGSNMTASLKDDPATVAAKLDMEDYAATMDLSHDGETVDDEDSQFFGKSLEFVRANEELEQAAEAVGAEVVWGDFDATLRTGQLFDSATHHGVSAQIGKDGQVLARAAISEQGQITLYSGAAGEDVVVTSNRKPTIQAALADLVAAIVPAPAEPEPQPAPSAAAPADNDLARLAALKKLVSKDAIRSDDPQAIDKLKAKLAYLSAYGDMMRKANKLVRKEDRAALTAMGFSGPVLENLFKPDFAGRKGFPDYEMANNNGEMRRTRLRLEQLERERGAVEPDEPESAVEPEVQPDPQPEPEPEPQPEPQQEPTPMPQETPAESPEQAADRAYLNSLIDGSGDLLAEDTFTKLEPMFAKYAEGTEMYGLLEKAATVYGDAAVKAAQDALATPA